MEDAYHVPVHFPTFCRTAPLPPPPGRSRPCHEGADLGRFCLLGGFTAEAVKDVYRTLGFRTFAAFLQTTPEAGRPPRGRHGLWAPLREMELLRAEAAMAPPQTMC